MLPRVSPNDAWSVSNAIVLCALRKRSNPTCRECQKSIESLRVGLIYTHRDGFTLFRWFHLGCLKLPSDIGKYKIEGFNDPDIVPYKDEIRRWFLKQKQEELKKNHSHPNKGNPSNQLAALPPLYVPQLAKNVSTKHSKSGSDPVPVEPHTATIPHTSTIPSICFNHRVRLQTCGKY